MPSQSYWDIALCSRSAHDVSLVFAAFLAGFAVVHKKRQLFAEALDAIGKVSFAFFIPVYFAIVGLKLGRLVRGLSLWMLAAFLIGTVVRSRFFRCPWPGDSRASAGST